MDHVYTSRVYTFEPGRLTEEMYREIADLPHEEQVPILEGAAVGVVEGDILTGETRPAECLPHVKRLFKKAAKSFEIDRDSIFRRITYGKGFNNVPHMS